MKRVITAIIGLDSVFIAEKKTLTTNDRNLQYLYLTFDKEIDTQNYDLMLRYREDCGKVYADVYEITEEMNVQIPNTILTKQQTIILEFCFLSKADNSRITVSRKIALNVMDTIDNIVESDDVIVGTNITDLVQKVINEIKAGKEELENIGNLAVAKIKAQEKESSETLAQNLEEHKQALEQKKDDMLEEIGSTASNSVGEVNTAKDNALREIREKKDTVVAELESNKTQQVKEITQTREKAIQDINVAKSSALENIATETSGALEAITSERDSSVLAVTNAKSSALGELEKTKSTAIGNIQQAGESVKQQVGATVDGFKQQLTDKTTQLKVELETSKTSRLVVRGTGDILNLDAETDESSGFICFYKANQKKSYLGIASRVDTDKITLGSYVNGVFRIEGFRELDFNNIPFKTSIKAPGLTLSGSGECFNFDSVENFPSYLAFKRSGSRKAYIGFPSSGASSNSLLQIGGDAGSRLEVGNGFDSVKITLPTAITVTKEINEIIKELMRVIIGGHAGAIFIQDNDTKLAGQCYVDRNTGRLYYCKNTTSTTSVTNDFELATNSILMEKITALNKRVQALEAK